MRSTSKAFLAALIAAALTAIGVVIFFAFKDHWPAARVGIVVTAAAGLLTLLGVLVALKSSDDLRREQLAEQREAAFQRAIDREISHRNNSLEAASTAVDKLGSVINDYEELAAILKVILEDSERGIEVANEVKKSTYDSYSRWLGNWRINRTYLMIQLIYVPLGVRSFAQYPLERLDEVAASSDSAESIDLDKIAYSLKKCRLAKQGLSYFEGLAAANLDPHAKVVIDFFTDVGSGPRVEPGTGRLVGPNFPEVRRQTEVDHVSQPQNPNRSR